MLIIKYPLNLHIGNMFHLAFCQRIPIPHIFSQNLTPRNVNSKKRHWTNYNYVEHSERIKSENNHYIFDIRILKNIKISRHPQLAYWLLTGQVLVVPDPHLVDHPRLPACSPSNQKRVLRIYPIRKYLCVVFVLFSYHSDIF
jgi:hypothetical protein